MAILDGFVIERPLGEDNADNDQSTTLVTANKDGSILERLEALLLAAGGLTSQNPNYGTVSITFAAGTTGSVATHELLTVTGAVRLWLMPLCTVNVSGSGTIELGIDTDTDLYITTTNGTDIDAGEAWVDASPAEIGGNYSSLVLDKVVINGTDVGYEIKTDTLTGGTIVFHYAWVPISVGATVVAADGTGSLT
jgi:hypothetical protein